MNEAWSSIGHFLQNEFELRRRGNPSYSMRAFARDLGFSSGALSEVIKGTRHISINRFEELAPKLQLSETETLHFKLQIALQKGSRASQEIANEIQEEISTLHRKGHQIISLGEFEVASNWLCFAILNLSDTCDFTWNPEWIANRFSTTVSEVSTALQSLHEVGLISWDPEKQSAEHLGKMQLATPSDLPSRSIRRYHSTLLQKAQESVEKISHRKRMVSGIGFAINKSRFNELKNEIDAFMDDLLNRYCDLKEEKHEVYQLQVALFPLSQVKEEDS